MNDLQSARMNCAMHSAGINIPGKTRIAQTDPCLDLYPQAQFIYLLFGSKPRNPAAPFLSLKCYGTSISEEMSGPKSNLREKLTDHFRTCSAEENKWNLTSNLPYVFIV
jgi:hypothetical protein